MKLIEAKEYTNFDVKRDGQFSSLGFVTYESDDMLVFVEDRKYIGCLSENRSIKCVITLENLISDLPKELGVTVCDCPRKAFYDLHNFLATNTEFYWKSFRTKIDRSAMVHPKACVADQDVIIGKDVIIEPNVTILERVLIADNSIIRAGTVVGSQGFEFHLIGGEMCRVVHAGGVRIGKRVARGGVSEPSIKRAD